MEKYYLYVNRLEDDQCSKLRELGVVVDREYRSLSAYAIRVEPDKLSQIKALPFVKDIERQGPDTHIL